jgi:hypothetical protein
MGGQNRVHSRVGVEGWVEFARFNAWVGGGVDRNLLVCLGCQMDRLATRAGI